MSQELEQAKFRLFEQLSHVFPEPQAFKNPAKKISWAVGYYIANNPEDKKLLKPLGTVELANLYVKWHKEKRDGGRTSN